MAYMKWMAAYNSEGIGGLLDTESPNREETEYLDPLSDEPINLQALPRGERGDPLVSKEKLYAMQSSGELSGPLRNVQATAEWDHLVVDLTSYGERAQDAHNIIRDTLRNPDYTVTKNQGKGKFQDITVHGTRGIIDMGVHTNREDGGVHSHLAVHAYPVDREGKRISQGASLGTKMFADAEFKAINESLTAKGFAPLQNFELGQRAGIQQTDVPRAEAQAAATQAVQAAMQGQDPAQAAQAVTSATALPTASGVPAIDDARMRDMLLKARDAAMDRTARLTAELQAEANRAAYFETALQAVHQAETLKQENAEQARTIEQFAGMLEQARDERTVFVNQIAERDEQITGLRQDIETLAEEGQAKDAKISGLEEQAATQSQAIEILTHERDETREQLVDAQHVINEQRGQIDTLEQRVSAQTNEIDDLQTVRDEQQKKIVGLETENLELKSVVAARDKKLEEQAETISEQRGTIGRLEADLAESNRRMKEMLDRFEQFEAARKLETEAAKEREAGLRDDNAALRTDRDELRKELAENRAEREAMRKEMDANRVEREQLKTEVAEARQDAKQTSGENDELKKANEKLADENKQLAEQNRKLQEQVAALRQRLEQPQQSEQKPEQQKGDRFEIVAPGKEDAQITERDRQREQQAKDAAREQSQEKAPSLDDDDELKKR